MAMIRVHDLSPSIWPPFQLVHHIINQWGPSYQMDHSNLEDLSCIHSAYMVLDYKDICNVMILFHCVTWYAHQALTYATGKKLHQLPPLFQIFQFWFFHILCKWRIWAFSKQRKWWFIYENLIIFCNTKISIYWKILWSEGISLCNLCNRCPSWYLDHIWCVNISLNILYE